MSASAYNGGAHYAVAAFFVLSGFYMDLVLNEKYLLRAERRQAAFISRASGGSRPPSAAVLLLSVFLAWYSRTTLFGQWLQPTRTIVEQIGLMSPLWQAVVVISNATTFLSDLMLFFWFDAAGGAHVYYAGQPAGATLMDNQFSSDAAGLVAVDGARVLRPGAVAGPGAVVVARSRGDRHLDNAPSGCFTA